MSRLTTSGVTSAARIGPALVALVSLRRSTPVTCQPRPSTARATSSRAKRSARCRGSSRRASRARAERSVAPATGGGAAVGELGGCVVVLTRELSRDLDLDRLVAVDGLEALVVDLGRQAVEHEAT